MAPFTFLPLVGHFEGGLRKMAVPLILLACLLGVVGSSDTADSGIAEIRLVNGQSRCSGRVEVLHNGTWGTICDDDWDMEDARVVCRQLKCSTAVSAPTAAFLGEGTGPTWLDDVRCKGTEPALSQCPAPPWGEHNCYHAEDAGVICLEVRLENGPTPCAGRVEVLRNETWGTVRDNGWGLNEARVVCREMGCGDATAASGGAKFGQGSGPIWMDGVNCIGSEDGLSKCPATHLAEHGGDHSKDASVECEELPEIRLANGPHRCSGRVEILHEKRWGTVCGRNWDLEDAKVVCRYLGCGAALSIPRRYDFGAGSGPIWLDSVNCTGTEKAISECPAKGWGDNDCSHAEDAPVICGEVRLRNGSNRCSGRVEVYHNEQWGTICDDGWDLQDSEVVCRELNCGNALEASGGTHDSHRSGPIWLSGVHCRGNETSFKQCPKSPWGEQSCGHGKVVSVECSGQIRLVNGSNQCSGRVEVFYNQQWGTICNDVWSIRIADVVCRGLSCGVALAGTEKVHFGKGTGPIWLDNICCNGTEALLTDCTRKPWGDHNCQHEEDAGVVCSELKVVNGSSHCSGRVEILHNKQWGTICHDHWGMKEAEVVCKQIGCGPALKAHRKAWFGEGSGPIWKHDGNCNGTEMSLHECTLGLWNLTNCHHEADVGVECAEMPEIRLVDGPSRCSGRVEILREKRWGTVCDGDWDLHDATVVCRYLGCGAALSAPRSSYFGQGHGPIWRDGFNCTGREEAISKCHVKEWVSNRCSHYHDAGVECAELRLVNGSGHCSGRVEMLHNKQWGTICHDHWSMKEAEVVCRELGCGAALKAHTEALFGQGSGPIWKRDGNCNGTEMSLRECTLGLWNLTNCHHEADVGVECAEMPEIRLVDGLSRCSGRVEIFLEKLWGTVYDGEWDLRDATVVCRYLGCGVALSAPRGSHFGKGRGPTWLNVVNCTGTEDAISKCHVKRWEFNYTSHYHDAGVECREVRLMNGSNHCSGRVEVYHNEQWGTICDDGWDLQDSQVVCQELDCGNALEASGGTHDSHRSGPIRFSRVNCRGNETSLKECHKSPWGEQSCGHGKVVSVECSGQIRLVNGSNICSGRVEMFHNQQWGTVCNDQWNIRDAEVVCRDLGCGVALTARGKAHFGKGSGPIWMEDVSCKGTEALLKDCPRKSLGQHNCQHEEDAGVVCSALRLVNGSSHCSGRVEILHNKQWGTICHDHWGMKEAEVVCKQIGCGPALKAHRKAWFGQGSGPIWKHDGNCNGTEMSLHECKLGSWNLSNCHHEADVGVECAEIRLVDGPSRCSGRVEILREKRWGTVCDGDWDLRDATVVCRYLGCGAALSAPQGSHFGKGHGPIWLNGVNCTGTEEVISKCRVKGWEGSYCSHYHDAGVECGEIRVTNGSDHCSGRVEVYHNEQWGTICNDGWDIHDAQVVCREMKCGNASLPKDGARYGQGSGTIWLDRVNCRGNETALKECPVGPWGEHSCDKGQRASVECLDSYAIRLVNGSNQCSGRVEVFHKQKWGTVCHDGWHMDNAKVICKELGCGIAIEALRASHFGEGSGPIWLDDVDCNGTEAALKDCRENPWGKHNCNHKEDASVVCSELRVVNGSSHCSGRAEILHNKQWGTICHDHWGMKEAEVVCKQIDCGPALKAHRKAWFGEGSGPIWKHDGNCNGTEMSLHECKLGSWSLSNCHHEADVGVECADSYAIRLVNGSNQCSGRVEVFHKQKWGTVCHDGWHMDNAKVVCKELGCGTAIEALRASHFGEGSGPIWLDNVDCKGTEAALKDCRKNPWGKHNCNHKEDASVVCSDALQP